MRRGRRVANEVSSGGSDFPAQKGDLCELKNWRPVALLCADYTIFAKVLANRLKSHLDSIVHKDQTYCVPGCSITDNLFLIRDMLDLLRVSNVNFILVYTHKHS